MQIRGDVVAQQGKESSDSKCLIAIAHDLKVYRIRIKDKRETGSYRIDRDHEENPYDTF